MNAKKILFPTDFSEAGNEALRFAASLARDADATLIIAHVEEPPIAYGAGEVYMGFPEPDTAALEKALRAVTPGDAKVRHEHRLLSGPPADTIVDLARAENVDLIVMSTHGRTGLWRLLMGSVAEAVVRNAECPVVTIKPGRRKEAEAARA